jgi:hypothetical protein
MAASDSRATRTDLVLDLAVAALLGFLAWELRRAGLGASTLWLDDAWQALVARVHRPEDMRLVEAFSPGFAWLLRGWFSLAGFSEATAQALPLVFGVALPPAVYLLAARSGFSRPGAALAAMILAASPMHATFSSRVKQYSLEALLALGLVGLALKAARRSSSIAWQWATTLAAILAPLISAATAVVAGCAVASLVVAHRRGERLVHAVAGLVLYVLVAGAWWALVLRLRAPALLHGYWQNQMIDGASVLAWGSEALTRILEALSGLFVGDPPLWALFLAVAAWRLAMRNPASALLLAGPLVVAVGLAALHLAPLGGGRTDIHLYVPLALLAASGLRPGPEAPRGLAIAAGVAAVALGVLAVVFSPGSRRYPAEDVRPLIELVEEIRADGDVVLVYPLTRYAYALYGSSTVRLEPSPDLFAVHFDDPAIRVVPPSRRHPERYAESVGGLTEGASSVYFVASHMYPDALVIEDALESAGFYRVEDWGTEGAMASFWARLKGQ